jgi:23S rRNA (cytosine1962-C5)-methyltransferase
LLVLASCSSRVVSQSFFDINLETINNVGRTYKTVLTTEHDIDHPITFPEGAYLKCGYYRFLDG